MKDQPKPRKEDAATPTTGEWTVTQEARIRIVNYLGGRVKSPFLRYEEDEIECIINAALAAERCEVCNSELSQCGVQGVDGEPSLDCLVCKLREQLAAEREKTRHRT